MDPNGERRVLIAGVGNVFRTDDGFGPAVARCLAGLPWPAGVRGEDYGIRGLHLAYDLLDPWDALILVDALPDTGDVGGVVLMDITDEQAPESAQVDPHVIDPATVLVAVATLSARLPLVTLLVGFQIADTTY